ncbi:polysaccharide pyruvyl transferase CsaB [Desulfohalotomaculum tongense]|uniref:polysaccharide pyruvyl transferase CsaB n=1 Tax=Desulforadius tongensis TaxID=1216062 RepID=UPI00195B9702|nr:polysaccharide pyruvyl transferase CsaB [Desulforadius tongensis]MBM7853693.1 polysaccharide pyruvyl transferase CsaB [Desulforadius tongensis]
MAKVVLSGYYGFDNTGDEAILFSIIQALRDKEPGLEITVLSNNPARTECLYRVKAVNRWRPGEVAAAVKDCHLFISGGGSLLQDVTGLKSLGYYLGVITLARGLGKPVFFYAQGIGPVTSRAGRAMMRMVVNRVQVITVRDEQSKEDLLAMGVNKPPITVTADPVLGVKVSGEERQRGREILWELGMDADRPVLAVSVRDWKGPVEAFQRELARCCDIYAGKGWQVLFLPLHFPGDVAACKKIAALMEKPASILKGNYTVMDFTGIISACTMLVGMRLHSIIIAAAAGVPPVGISYDPKIDRFLQRLNLTPACCVTDRHFDLLPHLERISSNLPGERERLDKIVRSLRNDALHTAELVVDFIKVRR